MPGKQTKLKLKTNGRINVLNRFQTIKINQGTTYVTVCDSGRTASKSTKVDPGHASEMKKKEKLKHVREKHN
jgi:hypothetical protein